MSKNAHGKEFFNQWVNLEIIYMDKTPQKKFLKIAPDLIANLKGLEETPLIQELLRQLYKSVYLTQKNLRDEI